jgi:ADP-ribosyl-[dinitrogen reductase] hydrolase
MFGFSSKGNTVFTLEVPGKAGLLGMSACPGVRLDTPRRGNPVRNLKKDILAYQEWGATGVVTLVEEHELNDWGVAHLGAALDEAGIWWKQLPIVDMDVPTPEFERAWAVESPQLKSSLEMGERIVFHCLAGLGRTGMMLGRLLVEFGCTPAEAIMHVRRVRPRAIQTQAQEDYVRALGKPKSRENRWSRLHQSTGGRDEAEGAA